jgi:histidine triad (HIT) family protein
MESEEFAAMFSFAQRVAKGIKEALPCKRVGVAVLGLEVPHAHIHLIPINSESDMDFRKPKIKLESSVMADIANAINSRIKL